MSRHELKQSPARLRIGGYPKGQEQLGAFAKLLDVLISHAPPEVVAELPADALEVLETIRQTKARFPKDRTRTRSR